MKIFITGRSGFIATNLIKALTLHHVIGSSSRDDDVTLALIAFSPDIICHLAAESYDADKMVEANILLTHSILEYCRKYPVKKLILFGSSSEYGRKDHPLTERDSLEPRTMYEGTKAAASMLARAYAYTYTIPTIIVRPLSIYGPHEHPNKLITRLFSGRITHLNDAMHDWTYIDDFIGAVLVLINNPLPYLFDTVNVGLGVQRSNRDVLLNAERVLGRKISVEMHSTSMGAGSDSNLWVCDPTHLKTAYGFVPTITLEEGMERFMKFLMTSHT
jgi:nucleoside-diphosphate-sugar epimerase